MLVGAVLALLFGPRLAAHDAGPISPSAMTAAVLGPTTTDHDSIGSGVDTVKRTLQLALAVLAAVLVVVARRAWRPVAHTEDRDWITWRDQRQRRRGPPLLPA